MKEFMETIKSWFARQREQMKARSDHRKYDRLWHEAGEKFQVKEYDGKVWLAVDGQPMLEAEDLTQDFARTLETARSAWIDYMMGERSANEEYPSYRDYGRAI